MAYGVSEKGITVNLYGGNRLSTALKDGSLVELAQESAYPWEGDVALTVSAAPASPFAIALRIPHWAAGAALAVSASGKTEEFPCQSGSYAEIERVWRAGDTIRLRLPLRPRILLAHPLIEESRNQAAVMRGPVVYCLESEDLPAGVGIKDVFLPSDAVFSETRGQGQFAGMTFLSCAGERLVSEPDDGLYRELKSRHFEEFPLKLLPYFAWDNRSPGEMTVWLPLRWM